MLTQKGACLSEGQGFGIAESHLAARHLTRSIETDNTPLDDRAASQHVVTRSIETDNTPLDDRAAS